MNIDLITMIGNVARSLFSVQHLVSGLAYVLGFLLIFTALQKYKSIAGKRANASSQEKIFVPTAYLFGGAALIFLPSVIDVASNTAFGIGNILQYSKFNPFDIVSSMKLIVRTAGLIWFVRGCILLIHASEPGVQEGPKGLTFLVAGILAMNFDNTVYYFTYVFNQLLTLTMTTPTNSG